MRGWLLVLSALAVGCGADRKPGDGGDGDEQEGATITLALDQTALTLAELTSADVHLTATLTGDLAGANVTFAVTPPPAGLTATIAGDTLTLSAALLAARAATPIQVASRTASPFAP